MSRPNHYPIPPISIPESDSKHSKVTPLIKYYNTSSQSFQNQPPIVSPSPQRLYSTGRSPRTSSIPRSLKSSVIAPFQHFDTDFLFDIVKTEKINDIGLNDLIVKLEQRLLKLIPDAQEKIKKEKENSMLKEKKNVLQIETTLLFEAYNSSLEQVEDVREKEIKILEGKLKQIQQYILARNNQQG